MARQPDDALRQQLEQRLLDEGFPPERAESLAGALLGSGPPLAEALGEADSELDQLTLVLDDFAKQATETATSIENAGERAADAARRLREHRQSHEHRESALRRPLHAVEREVHELRDTAASGRSAATPAILAGSMVTFLIPIIALVLVLAFGAAYLVKRHNGSGGITAAPAFSADELATLPTENWITNGGSLANQRYSPLTEVDSSNVAELNGVWHTHLRGSTTAAKYSAESQPLVYKGTVYVPTGEDDVFAVNAETGEIRWQYKANLDQKISTVCCGWESRGVALGDGKVYIGQLDGSLVALDQKTGDVAWKTVVGRWQDGYSITSAPLYLGGMVITGVSGGEFGIRGRVTAFDAQTGKEVWRFYTIPGPGETGHETWPAKGDAWKHGGAPVWQTPSVDPKLGLLYFSTGNAGPDNDGSGRAGKNLFAASMVALDVKTGKLRWHYQMVHHDIWDYDAPSPTVLFDVTINGTLRHGIGEASKTGWLYLLDRTNGKPLLPIPEKPVPQNANQKTWPTQPTPSYPPFVPHVPNDKQYNDVVKQLTQAAGHRVKAIRAKTMFTPYWKTPVVYTPGPQGGTNWQPSSYNPKTQMFYVCAQSGPVASTAETEEQTQPKAGAPVKTQIGSTLDGVRRLRLQHRVLHSDRRPHGAHRLAEEVAGVVLRRLGDDRGQPGLRGSLERQLARLRRSHRQATLELPDRRRREQRADDLRAERQPVRALLRRGQRARGLAARRRPLALRPRRHARHGLVGPVPQGTEHRARPRRRPRAARPRHRARRPPRRRRPRGTLRAARPPAPPSSRKTVRRVTASRVRGQPAAPT